MTRIFRFPSWHWIAIILFFLIILIRYLGSQIHVNAAPIDESLWGIAQECSFKIIKPHNSIDGPRNGFDGRTASCSWETSSNRASGFVWTYTQIQDISITNIRDIKLETGFYIQDWENEEIVLQISADGGQQWTTVETFSRDNPPPAQMRIDRYDLRDLLNSYEYINDTQVRLMSDRGENVQPRFTVFMDEVRLKIVGSPPATDISDPTSTLTPTNTLPPLKTQPLTATFLPTITETFVNTPTSPPERMPRATLTPTSDFPLLPITTATSTQNPTTTMTPVSLPPISGDVQTLWGLELQCDFPLSNPEAGLDQQFNEQFASCSGAFTGNLRDLRYPSLQDTAFTHINLVIIDIRLYVVGWENDRFDLEILTGQDWVPIAQFGKDGSYPPQEPVTLSYDVSQFFPSPELINQTAVRLVGVGSVDNPDVMTIFLDEVRLRVAGGLAAQINSPPLPTPPDPPPAPTNTPVSGDPHVDHPLLTDSCAACHRNHTATGLVNRNVWPEESVCFSCHGNGGSGTNVQPAFTNYTNTATGYYKHDIFQTSGIHRLGQSGGGDFGGNMRHIECEDCHSPHRATRGPANPPIVQRELVGISGVDPLWNSPGPPSAFVWLTTAAREYQVCFKCHSSFTSLPSYAPDGWNGNSIVPDGLKKLTNADPIQVPDQRDLALEFNPYQSSFHPVITLGRNQNIPPGSFMPGWSQGSMVYCTDCHTNANASSEGDGPHGSPLLHILDGSANYSTAFTQGSQRVSSSELCFKCHNYQTYVTGQNQSTHFREHDKHMDNNWGTTCYTCHDTHGSEQLHLINFDASVMSFLNGRNSQTAWYYDAASGKAGCYLSCHNKAHNPKEYDP